MTNQPELPYCRKCGGQVTTVLDATVGYPYECNYCDEYLFNIETIFLDNISRDKEVNCKTLEKKMSFDELQKFLESRPQYRLIRRHEVNTYKDHIPSETFFLVGHKNIDGKPYPKTFTKTDDEVLTRYESGLFKFRVFLVKNDNLATMLKGKSK